MYDILELSKKLLPELRDIAKKLNIKKAESLKKQDLIYKILDQQAIEAVDSKKSGSMEKEKYSYAPDIHRNDSDSSVRRGRRPRTSKAVTSRPVESVMSVTPDGMKITEQKHYEKSDNEQKPSAQTEEKTEPTLQNSPVNEERNENLETGTKEVNREVKRKEYPEKISKHIPEKAISDHSQDKVINDTTTDQLPDSAFDEKNQTSDIYNGDIIVDPPVKEVDDEDDSDDDDSPSSSDEDNSSDSNEEDTEDSNSNSEDDNDDD